MPRDGGSADVRWFDVEPCYVFHPMNAYDDGDTVVLDVIRHPKMFDTDHLGPNEGPPTLDRWTVDLADGKVRESRIDDRAQEFPVSTSASSASGTGTATRLRSVRAPPVPARCSSTTSWAETARRDRSASRRRWASSCFIRPHPTPPRTTAC